MLNTPYVVSAEVSTISELTSVETVNTELTNGEVPALRVQECSYHKPLSKVHQYEMEGLTKGFKFGCECKVSQKGESFKASHLKNARIFRNSTNKLILTVSIELRFKKLM